MKIGFIKDQSKYFNHTGQDIISKNWKLKGFKSCFRITNRILNKDGALGTSGFLIIFDRTHENTIFHLEYLKITGSSSRDHFMISPIWTESSSENPEKKYLKRRQWCWWHRDVVDFNSNFDVGDRRSCEKQVDMGDQNAQHRHQHLSPTSMMNL